MKILIGLAIMIFLQAFLFLSQTAVTNLAMISGEQAPSFFEGNNSFIGSFNNGGYTISENVTEGLPSGGYNVQPSGGNFFVDIFLTIKNWLLDNKGLRYFVAYVNAPANFFKSLLVPPEVSFALGFLWNAFSWFLFILFLRGNV